MAALPRSLAWALDGSDPLMRFWLRALLIVLGIFATFFGVPRALVALGLSPSWALAIMLLLILLGGNGLLYAALRCPKCGKWACQMPSGYATVWPGFRCRYCQQEY